METFIKGSVIKAAILILFGLIISAVSVYSDDSSESASETDGPVCAPYLTGGTLYRGTLYVAIDGQIVSDSLGSLNDASEIIWDYTRQKICRKLESSVPYRTSSGDRYVKIGKHFYSQQLTYEGELEETIATFRDLGLCK